MGVDSTRSTKITPDSLSTSYLTGSTSLGISMMTLISSGGFLPVFTWSRPMMAPVGRSAGRCPGRGVGKEVHSTRRAAATQQTAARALLTRGGVPGGPAEAYRADPRWGTPQLGGG